MRSRPSSLLLATTAMEDGGVWRHVGDLAAGMDAAGLPVAVARGAGEIRRALRDRGALVHLHLHDSFEPLGLTLALRRRIVVTEHLPHTNASDPALWPAAPPRRGSMVARTAFKRLQLARAASAIAVSEASATFMRGRYGLRDGAVLAVPNGVAPRAAALAPAPSDGPLRLVVMGALIIQKGVDVLVEACAGSAGRVAIDVLGDGPHRAELVASARRLGAPVTFHGHQPDPAPWLERAHALCLPSRWEGLPYAALDAMAAGRPVLCAAVDGLPELVRDGVEGRLFAPGDPAALAAVLEACAADPAALAPMGTAARARVTADFALDAMLERTRAVYAEAGL